MSAAHMTREQWSAANQALAEKLASDDPALFKQAKDGITDFTRKRMREDGFFRRILPMQTVTASDLDRAQDHAFPQIIVDMEPDSPAAISVGYASLPDSLYIEGDRYAVKFGRIMSTKWTKDVVELMSWIMDIRQVLSDNSIRDMLAEEDNNWLRVCNEAVVGPDEIVPTSGVVQHAVLNGGITKENWAASLEVLPGTPASLEPQLILINNITIKKFLAWSRNEWGGDIADEIARKGQAVLKDPFGIEFRITIKKGLVPTNTVYHFADPKFTGKSFELEATTMYVRREAFFIEFYAYECIGSSLANTSSVARIDFK